MGRRDVATVHLEAAFFASHGRRGDKTRPPRGAHDEHHHDIITNRRDFRGGNVARASANTRASAATWPVASGLQAVTTRRAVLGEARRGPPARRCRSALDVPRVAVGPDADGRRAAQRD